MDIETITLNVTCGYVYKVADYFIARDAISYTFLGGFQTRKQAVSFLIKLALKRKLHHLENVE